MIDGKKVQNKNNKNSVFKRKRKTRLNNKRKLQKNLKIGN